VVLEGAATLVEAELPQPAVARVKASDAMMRRRGAAALFPNHEHGRATEFTPLLECRKVAIGDGPGVLY